MTTLSITKQSRREAGAPTGHRSAPGAERIREAYEAASTAIDKAMQKALYCGFLLMEQRNALSTGGNKNQHTPNGDKFYFWLEKTIPEIPLRTAQRWMQAAERSAGAIGAGPIIEVEGEVVPMSQILFAPEAELPAQALKYRQTFFKWAADKTIKDCLNAVAVEGEDSKRITLTHNGKNAKGAGGGGDRKDYPLFVARHFKAVLTALHKMEEFQRKRPAQAAEIANIIRPFVASDVPVLRKLNSPIIRQMKEAAKPKESRLATETTDEEGWELILQFTRTCAERDQLIAEGREHFRKVAIEEIGDRLNPGIAILLNAMVGAGRAKSNEDLNADLQKALAGPLADLLAKHPELTKKVNPNGPQSTDQAGSQNPLLGPAFKNATQYEKIGFVLNTVAGLSADSGRQTASNTGRMVQLLQTIKDKIATQGPGQNAALHHPA